MHAKDITEVPLRWMDDKFAFISTLGKTFEHACSK
jgi:hypothetical protein